MPGIPWSGRPAWRPSPVASRILFAFLWLLTQPSFAQDCDDGFLCTFSDTCVDGECTGTRVECPDDGDACTRERCAATNGECVSEPRNCSGPCLTGACDPQTGCVPLPDGAPCDDGKTCTSDDRCLLGVCQGAAVEDGTPCADALGPCTTNDRCRRGSCIGEFLVCPDTDRDRCTPESCDFLTGTCVTLPRTTCDRPCETGTCDAETGLCPTLPDGAACSDANECSLDDGCQAGECVGGGAAARDTFTPTVTATGMSSRTTTRPSVTATAMPPTATMRPATHSPVPATATMSRTANAPRTFTSTSAPTLTSIPSSMPLPLWRESEGCTITGRKSSSGRPPAVLLGLALVGSLRLMLRRRWQIRIPPDRGRGGLDSPEDFR